MAGSGAANSNGYAKLASVLQLVGVAGGVLALYISLSLAPMRDAIQQSKDDIKDIRAQIVPRGEHIEKWSSQRDRDAELLRSIELNRQDIKSIFTPSDAFKAYDDRIARLEEALRQKS